MGRKLTSVVSPGADGAADDILDGLVDAFFAVDRERRLTFLNKAAAALCNQPRQALVGRPLVAVLPEPVQGAMESALAAAAATGQRIRTTAAIAAAEAPIEIDVQPAGGFAIFIRDAAAQSALQQDLGERLERLRLAEQAAAAGIWDIDVRTDTVRGTPQFFLIMGLEPTDAAVPMRTLRDLRIPDDRSRVNRGYADAVDSGADFYESEYRIRRKGETRWIFGRGRVIRDAAGKPVRYSGVDIDITDRKTAELALAESEARLKLAVEAADIGIWDWDVLAMTMSYSDRAKALYGFRARSARHLRAGQAGDAPRGSAAHDADGPRALDPAVRAERGLRVPDRQARRRGSLDECAGRGDLRDGRGRRARRSLHRHHPGHHRAKARRGPPAAQRDPAAPCDGSRPAGRLGL